MIVGNGLIARVFKGTKFDSLGITIFASGVSDSLSKNTNAFLREETLLKKYLALNQPLVYFSTLSIFDPTRNQSHYVRHKIEMEKLVSAYEVGWKNGTLKKAPSFGIDYYNNINK